MEPIELTRAERRAGINALRETDSGYGWGMAFDNAWDAINRVRAGDPVGTIRREPGGTAVAIREYAGPPDTGWRLMSITNDTLHFNNLSGFPSDWPVIYTPDSGE